MGGFNPISTVLGLAGLNRAYDTGEAYRTAQKKYELNEKILAEERKASREKLALETAEENRKRRDALKRTVARQRAAFGAQGIDTSDGSGQAVLLGLFEENDADRAYRERLNKLRAEAIEQDYANSRRKNLLSLQSSYDSARSGLIDNSLDSFKGLYNNSH